MSKKTLQSLVLRVATPVVVVLVAGVAYYCFGHHNCVGSRSYFLEKRIRTLLYFETHEPIDYTKAANDYAFLLRRIRFDNRDTDYSARYARALNRARIKAEAYELFEEYERTSDPATLVKAWSILHDDVYRKNDEYGSLSFYYKKQHIDQEWIDKRIQRSDATAM